MLTYQTIIGRLTEAQKVSILTDLNRLSDPALVALGVPSMRMARLDEGGGHYPSAAALTRSWDPSLIEQVSIHASAKLGENDVRLVLLPGARAAVGAVSGSLSEDPLLAGDAATAYLKGANTAGLPACLDGYGVGYATPAFRRWSEEAPDEQVMWDHLIHPYRTTLAAGEAVGLLVENGMTVPPFSEMAGLRILRRRLDADETVLAIARGEICLVGSAPALQDALHTYRRLQNAVTHGKAAMGELEAAVATGQAISEETVDEAVDRLLHLADACSRAPIMGADSENGQLVEQALRESTVLLENSQNTLPLAPGARVALFGDVIKDAKTLTVLSGRLMNQGHSYIGYAPGYTLEDDRNDKLAMDAEKLAESADTAIVFLSAERERLTMGNALPANQMALVDRLAGTSARVVLVLSADIPPDMHIVAGTRRRPNAVLLAPLHVQNGPLRALETVLGMREPEGRLAHTAIDRNDPATDRHGLKVGPFLGYRYYSTIGIGAVYPFGHGLSFAKFRYSALTVSATSVTFTVTNVGKRAGLAVPQVYAGVSHSTVLRPRRELVGYARVRLEPGAKATVTIPMCLPGIYDASLNKTRVEAGVYTVSIGTSAADIVLSRTVRLGQDTIPPDGRAAPDYLPTVSNLQTEHYTLEAEFTPMKPTLRNPIFGISALVLAGLVKLYDIIAGTHSLFLTLISIALAIGSAVFLVFELIDRNRLLAEERARLEKASNASFTDADHIAVPSADRIFNDADSAAAVHLKKAAPTTQKSEGYDHFADVDKTLTFAVAAHDLAVLAAEKGLSLSEQTARRIFAALATSRLVVVKDMRNDDFSLLLSVLSEYLSCPACEEAVDASYTNEGAVLFRSTEAMNARFDSRIKVALHSAQSRERNIHLAALTDVTWEQLSAYFVPFARYARAPFSSCRVTVNAGGKTEIYHIPENLWFILNLRVGEPLVGIPDYVSDVATVNTWTVERIAPSVGGHTQFRQFYYGQMLYLTDRLNGSAGMDEDAWKKIDRLEAFVARYADFHMGNKMGLGMETYLSVLLSADEEASVALDFALAAQFLPAAISTLSGKIGHDEVGLGETLDIIFGDDHTVYSRKTLKESGAELM